MNKVYCDDCGVVEVRYPTEMCDGCVAAIVAWMEEEDLKYQVQQYERYYLEQ